MGNLLSVLLLGEEASPSSTPHSPPPCDVVSSFMTGSDVLFRRGQRSVPEEEILCRERGLKALQSSPMSCGGSVGEAVGQSGTRCSPRFFKKLPNQALTWGCGQQKVSPRPRGALLLCPPKAQASGPLAPSPGTGFREQRVKVADQWRTAAQPKAKCWMGSGCFIYLSCRFYKGKGGSLLNLTPKARPLGVGGRNPFFPVESQSRTFRLTPHPALVPSRHKLSR